MILVFKERGEKGFQKSLEELRAELREKVPNGHRVGRFDDMALMESLCGANELYDKNVPGEAASRKPVIGPVISFLKKIVRKAIFWYVAPSIDRQRSFNAEITRTINETKRYLDHLQINVDIMSTIMHRELTLFRTSLLYLSRYVERWLRDFESMTKAVAASSCPTGELSAFFPENNGGALTEEVLSSIDVLALEQRVQGSPRVVTERINTYIDRFDGLNRVIAVECGRGEILKVLKERVPEVKGSEQNLALADYCKDQGLDVERVDPFSFVEGIQPESVDGIVLSRFAGHVPLASLVRMLGMCREKLSDNGLLVLEAPNPFSLYGFANYTIEYADRTYLLHPETLKIICESCGFEMPEVVYLDPLPPEEHLEDIYTAEWGTSIDPQLRELFGKINDNFSRINRILFSHRDYVLITRKSV